MPRRRLESGSAMPWLGLPLAVLSTTWIALGCARLPTAHGTAQPRNVDSFQSAESLKAPITEWPTDQWWTRYGDPQLDGLIAEGLKDAPDLGAAAARLGLAEALFQVAGSARKTQVSANALVTEDRLSYNYLTSQSMTPNGWNDYGRLSLDFRWELDFWGKNRAALAAAS